MYYEVTLKVETEATLSTIIGACTGSASILAVKPIDASAPAAVAVVVPNRTRSPKHTPHPRSAPGNTLDDLIINIMRVHAPSPMLVSSIRAQIVKEGYTGTSAHAALSHLARRGAVRNVGLGAYVLVNHGAGQ